MGNLYFNQGDKELARKYYMKSAAVEDVFPQPHFNIGGILQSEGDMFGAIKEFERAIEIDPNFHYATLKLGQMYIDRGKIEDAKKLVCPVFPAQPLCL